MCTRRKTGSVARPVAKALWTRRRRTEEEVRDIYLEMFQQAGEGFVITVKATSGWCCMKKDEVDWR